MNDVVFTSRGKCPGCGHEPAVWRERPKYGSRELYWIGCQKDGLLAGGITQTIALQNWQRAVVRAKFDGLPKL